MQFFAIETDATFPGDGTYAFTKGYAVAPWPLLSRRPGNGASITGVRMSDTGYRTREADAGGLVAYPVAVDAALTLDRTVGLLATDSALATGAGVISAANWNGAYDAFVAGWVTDGRAVRVYRGAKVYDTTRGYWTDPPRADLAQVFGGLGLQWTATDSVVTLPIRDPSYWLEQPIQAARYSGAGGYNGHAGLANTPRPKARGGTAGNPIRNVRPVLIDPTTNTYQCSDGPCQIIAVYEGANPVYTFQANVANLFSGTTTTGSYRTDTANGAFQIAPAGGAPAGEITADVVGDFPVAGAVSALDSLARYLITEDSAVPAGSVNTATFTGLSYTAGVYCHPDDRDTGATVLDRLLRAAGARLVTRRDGRLALFVLRAPAGVPVAAFGESNAMGVQVETLGAPAWRVTVGYRNNHTIQTSGVSAGATAAQRAFVGTPGESVAWFSTSVLSAYPRAADVARIGGALLLSTDAQAVADAMGALYGVRRRVVWVDTPAEVGAAVDLGDVVRVTWPAENLASGQIGVVVGDRLRSQEGMITLRVLV